jgi:hypothetical protein
MLTSRARRGAHWRKRPIGVNAELPASGGVDDIHHDVIARDVDSFDFMARAQSFDFTAVMVSPIACHSSSGAMSLLSPGFPLVSP